MFRELIEERMRDRRVFVIDRMVPEQGERDLHMSLITEHVNAGLTRQMEEMGGWGEQDPPLDPERTFGSLGTTRQLYNHVSELLRYEVDQPIKTLDVPVLAGCRFISPPYDEEWNVGGGFAFGARHDGSVIIFGSPGFSAAGVGLYLSSETEALASITPVGTYNYNWVTLENLPSLQTRGGLGVAVYQGQDVVMSREAVVWSQSGAKEYTGQTGEGQIANAASPAFGFGPVPIGPVLLNMTPGKRYLFWVWSWQIVQHPDNAAFIAFLQMKMPSVTVCAGLPIVIR